MDTQTTTETRDLTNSTIYPETIAPREEVYYPSELEDEMGETAIHFLLISEFFHLLRAFFAPQNDVAIAANLMVYYDEGNPKKWLAPTARVSGRSNGGVG